MHTFLAATENIFGSSLMTALILVVIVFSVLVVLSLLIALFGAAGGSKKKAPVKTEATSVVQTPPATPRPAPAPVVDKEDEDEIAAVIAAAVAMMAPAGMTYRVRRITPAGGRSRSEWAAAAVRQNTMPF